MKPFVSGIILGYILERSKENSFYRKQDIYDYIGYAVIVAFALALIAIAML